MENNNLTAKADEAVIALRKCGHFLHHSAGRDSGKTNSELMSALSESEISTLTVLLGKCLESWKSAGFEER